MYLLYLEMSVLFRIDCAIYDVIARAIAKDETICSTLPQSFKLKINLLLFAVVLIRDLLGLYKHFNV